MKAYQYRSLAQRWGGRATMIGERLIIVSGKNKNKYCTVKNVSFQGGKITSVIEGTNEQVELHYTHYEQLDEDGLIKIYPIIDMTGREICVDNFVCYSMNDHSTHALEIGRVLEITKTGQLVATPLVKNGEKPKDRQYTITRRINDPFRCIKLPVDSTELVMWIMQDFSEMAENTLSL